MLKVGKIFLNSVLGIIRVLLTVFIGLFFMIFRYTLFRTGKQGELTPSKAAFIRFFSNVKKTLYEKMPWALDFLGIKEETKNFYYKIGYGV